MPIVNEGAGVDRETVAPAGFAGQFQDTVTGAEACSEPVHVALIE
jgi:hypothetical protein